MTRPVSVILNAGSSLGLAVARLAVDEGESVLVCDTDEKRLAAVEESLGTRVRCHHDAVHTQLGLRNGLAAARESFGRVDRVVAIPALPEPAALHRLDLEEFDRVLAKSARGAVIALRIFSDQMREQEPLDRPAPQRQPQRGAFVFVLGMGALLADPERFGEAVAQSAIVGAVRAGAVALAGDRIRVNAVAAIRPRAEREESWLPERTPLGRAALADEIALAVHHLNSDQAGYTTGQVLVLDGGRSALSGLVRRDI